MNDGLDTRLMVTFAGLGFAGIVLLLAWVFNRLWGKDKKSLWGRIWQIEKFLLTFTDMTLSVFGILQRRGKVYTEIVPDCAQATLQAIIRGKVSPDSVIHSDGWRGYNGLVDIGYK